MIWHPSPNFGPRKDGAVPELVVLHYTAMICARAARDWLCNPVSEVSAHYIISEQGEITQMVKEAARAWHAGAGSWGGSADVNSRSIGIELANPGDAPFAAAQMDTLEGLLAQVLDRHAIPPEGVIAHSDLAPGRKIDPGARFDWQRLARQGLAVWPTEAAESSPDPDVFCDHLVQFGYASDLAFETLLDSFRLRFAPALRGEPLTALDMSRAAGLQAPTA